MKTFITHPDGEGPFPAVVMYQNVGGLSDLMRDMARRGAAVGYYVAVPALYYRMGDVVIDPDSKDEKVLAVRKAASAHVDNANVMRDTRALIDFMNTDKCVRPGPMGCIGYCMGGRFAVLAAGTFPDRIRAAGALFGTRLITESGDSPHLLLPKMQGELYCGFAENDPSVPLPLVEKFAGLLKSCSVKHQVEVHPGTVHGYAFPGRHAYHKQAAERSWERIFAMFHRQLPPYR
jgi:carboxymethylenebutenolidase